MQQPPGADASALTPQPARSAELPAGTLVRQVPSGGLGRSHVGQLGRITSLAGHATDNGASAIYWVRFDGDTPGQLRLRFGWELEQVPQ